MFAHGQDADFGILEPAWLAVLAFAVPALFQGLLVAALAARVDRWPPPVSLGRTALTGARAAPVAAFLVALPGFVTSVADILDAPG